MHYAQLTKTELRDTLPECAFNQHKSVWLLVAPKICSTSNCEMCPSKKGYQSMAQAMADHQLMMSSRVFSSSGAYAPIYGCNKLKVEAGMM